MIVTKPISVDKTRKLTLFRSDENQYSNDCVNELYHEIKNTSAYEVTVQEVGALKTKVFIIGALRRIVKLFIIHLPFLNRKNLNFSAQLGPDFKVCLPAFLSAKNNFIYMFDAWPRFHHWMAPMLDLLNVKAIFFSSSEVHRQYEINTQSKCKSYWIPEGIDMAEYKYSNLKNIDVLEFGRKYQEYHNLVVNSLAEHGKSHVYLKDEETVLYRTREDFINGLAAAKISICVPSNITHPERAENISTMTLRYLQCMASKCLIVGILPEEMKLLFSYNPIITIDFDAPGQQLIDLLSDYDAYLELIDKNYNEVQQNHQWKNRWKEMQQIMNKMIED